EGQQVKRYRDEDRVAENSTTPTFVSGKLTIDNFRWAGVPFYIRTGKRMKSKTIQVVVEFKEVPMNLYYKTDKKLDSNIDRKSTHSSHVSISYAVFCLKIK